jgi:phosphohistidine swiveling domain-containing protein
MDIASVRRFVCRSALALTAAAGLPSVAQTAQSAAHPLPVQAVPEYKLKAAFVYNFVLFTDWPAANANEAAPINVCVNTDSVLRPALGEFNDKTVKGRRMQIRAWTDANADSMRQCHVLVLDSTDREHWAQLRKNLAGAAVLTVSDDADIGRNGAVITLYLENNRIAFDIDMNAARQARLTLSSKLLRLARTTP